VRTRTKVALWVGVPVVVLGVALGGGDRDAVPGTEVAIVPAAITPSPEPSSAPATSVAVPTPDPAPESPSAGYRDGSPVHVDVDRPRSCSHRWWC
jgi:hypothetical protein